jgi:peroxiredoxin
MFPISTKTEVKNKKVVIVAVPGAFTPTCQASHLPGFIQNIDALKAKGVDQVIVIASNDPYVMSAWGKANYTKDDFIVSFHPGLSCHVGLLAYLFASSSKPPQWISFVIFFFFTPP